MEKKVETISFDFLCNWTTSSQGEAGADSLPIRHREKILDFRGDPSRAGINTRF